MRQRVVDPNLLPHERPCWCVECKGAYRRIWQQNFGKKYTTKPKSKKPQTTVRNVTLNFCQCGKVRIGVDAKPLCRGCYLAQVTKHQWKRQVCRRCKKTWSSKTGKHKVCASCRRQVQKELPNLWRAPQVRGQCKDCGIPCEKFTCDGCATQNRRMARRIDNNRRRGATGADRYRKRDIAIRDGWLCHLCCGSVEPSLWGHHRHPESPNIDHVVPISRGGSDTAENVKLTHRVCNLRKSNKIGDDVGTRTNGKSGAVNASSARG